MLMKSTTVFMVLLACILVAACGGRHSPVSSEGIRGSSSDARESASAALPRGPTGVMTEEDLRVAQMPLEQRIIYLQRRLEGMLEEMKKNDAGGKSASVITADYNKVETTQLKEDLKLAWNGQQVGWKLSFLERLSGDLDFSGTVAIADITPLAIYFGHEFSGGEWPDNSDPHLDRISDHNGKIGIEDITPLAVNFGKHLIGYKVYFLPAGQSNWQQSVTPIADWLRWASFNCESLA